MSDVKRYYVTEAGLVEGQALGRINVVLAADYDSAVQCFLTAAEGCVSAERRERALQQRLTAADERADVLENALRELLSGTGTSPGANKKYGKARAVLEGLRKKADSRICSPANPHNYHLGECTKCGAISPTE